jgi:hypothetical protein
MQESSPCMLGSLTAVHLFSSASLEPLRASAGRKYDVKVHSTSHKVPHRLTLHSHVGTKQNDANLPYLPACGVRILQPSNFHFTPRRRLVRPFEIATTCTSWHIWEPFHAKGRRPEKGTNTVMYMGLAFGVVCGHRISSEAGKRSETTTAADSLQTSAPRSFPGINLFKKLF